MSGAGVRRTCSVQAIKTRGVLSAYQLRIDGGGAGNTKFFPVLRLGGPKKALRAANHAAKVLGLIKAKPRGGSVVGRVTKQSKTGAPGIRFAWSAGPGLPALRVFASWVSKSGTPRSTSYSVERNGLEGALDLAIKARTSGGAPAPAKEVLLKKLRSVYRTGTTQ